MPLKPDAYMWSVIFSQFDEDHPERDFVFDRLSEAHPPGFIAVALLDAANVAAISGNLDHHPFDSNSGIEILREFISNRDFDRVSYAISAIAALPFISHPAREQLLELAMEHPHSLVQIESAWASAKLGRESGLNALANFCLDVHHARQAQRYLIELDREDVIPTESMEPLFQARAEFANWLAHPNELGVAPDEVQLIDHRTLRWPPEYAAKPFWLLSYRLNDRTGLEPDRVGCGLVGSMTWCFFSYDMEQRPPEDNYAMHCYWEMRNQELITEADDIDAASYSSLLKQWVGAALEAPRVMAVADVSPKLKLANRLVGIAEARLDAQDGWVALDGAQSRWYPRADQPEGTDAATVLWVHVGRQLLGFEKDPDRRVFLSPRSDIKRPDEVITAYERVWQEVSLATSTRQQEVVDHFYLLGRHFEAYVDALVDSQQKPKSEILMSVYERWLQMAEKSDAEVAKELFNSSSLIATHFEAYVDALVENGRGADVLQIIANFAPRWKHNLGYMHLGTAAFKVGNDALAESNFVKLLEGPGTYCRAEEMSYLAEIWSRNSKPQEARDLLVNCLRGLIQLIAESKYQSSRELHANEYRFHHGTYCKLFPGGELELERMSIPVDPLRSFL